MCLYVTWRSDAASRGGDVDLTLCSSVFCVLMLVDMTGLVNVMFRLI